MAIDNTLFWFPKFAAHFQGLPFPPEVDDYAELNEGLSALPFGASKKQVNTFLANKGRVGSQFPADTVGNFTGFDEWRKTELAQMKLRRLVRERLGSFNRNANTAAFTAKLEANLDQVKEYLIDEQLRLIAGTGKPRAHTARFAALVDAFSNEARYAFTETHKQAFLTAVLDKLDGLLSAGVPAADISVAMVRFLPQLQDAEQFNAILELYRDGGVLRLEAASFCQALGDAKMLEALFAKSITLDQIRNAFSEDVTLEELFAPVIKSLDTTVDLPTVERLMAYVADTSGTGNRSVASSQRNRLHQKILANAEKLIQSAGTAEDLKTIMHCLRACDGLRDSLKQALSRQVKHLLQKNVGISIEDMAEACEPSAAFEAADGDAAQPAAAPANVALVKELFKPIIDDLKTADFPTMEALRAYVKDPRAASQKVDFDAAVVAQAARLFALAGDHNGATFQEVVTLLRECGGQAAVKTYFDNHEHVMALLERANAPLAIEGVQTLATGEADYTHRENAAFREAHIKSMIAQLETYVNSLTLEGAQWKHTTGTPAVEANCSVENIKEHLAQYKARLEKFNSVGSVVVYQEASHAADTHHGSRALQDFMIQKPEFLEKLSKVYSDADTLNKEFVMCPLTEETRQERLAEDTRQRLSDEVQRIAGIGMPVSEEIKQKAKEDFSALVPRFKSATAAIQAPVQALVKAHALDLLRRGVDPKHLSAIDPGLTIDNLYRQVSEHAVVDSAALQGALRSASLEAVDPLIFAKSLSTLTRKAIETSMKGPSLALRDAKQVCRIALQAVAKAHPDSVSEAGIVNATP